MPVVEVRSSTAPGGAGNVAVNLASLGCKVWLAGAVGSDIQAAKLAKLFANSPAISTYLYECRDRPTTTKTRILAHGHQVLRADREDRLANYAAGIVVGKVGTASVTVEELQGAWEIGDQ